MKYRLLTIDYLPVKSIFLLILLNLIWNTAFAQPEKTYKSLESAFENPESVYKLEISEQKLTELPAEIGKLINLQKLSLARNNLSSLPAEFAKLVNLNDLSLRGNKFTEVPLVITKLKKIKKLDIDNNKIQTYPQEFIAWMTVYDIDMKFGVAAMQVEKEIKKFKKENPNYSLPEEEIKEEPKTKEEKTEEIESKSDTSNKPNNSEDRKAKREERRKNRKAERENTKNKSNENIAKNETPNQAAVRATEDLKEIKPFLEEEKIEIIQKNQVIQERLKTISKTLKNQGVISPEAQNNLREEILALEKQLAENLKAYLNLQNQAQTDINEIKRLANIQEAFLVRNRQIIWILLGSLLGLAFLTFFFFRTAKLRKKQRDELAIKNEQINQQKEEIEAQRDQIEDEQKKSEALLLNIMPLEVAQELKVSGKATVRNYPSASVLFSDFAGFTNLAGRMSPEQLIEELNECFSYFDEITEKYNLERIKTIGDAYMCVGGVPNPNPSNPVDAILAGMEMQKYIEQRRIDKQNAGMEYWQCRIGINTGEVIAGVIGKKKFAYDVWSDTVNIASRMESSSEVGRINISQNTYELVKDFFEVEHRGKINAKGKGAMDMYFVKEIKSAFLDKEGLLNEKFIQLKSQKFQ